MMFISTLKQFIPFCGDTSDMQQEALILAQQLELAHYREYDAYLAWFEKQRMRCWFEDDTLIILYGKYDHRVEITRTAIKIRAEDTSVDFAIGNLVIQRDRDEAGSWGLFATVDFANPARREIITVEKRTQTANYKIRYPKDKSPNTNYPLITRKSTNIFSGYGDDIIKQLEKAATAWHVPRLHLYGTATCIERGLICCVDPDNRLT